MRCIFSARIRASTSISSLIVLASATTPAIIWLKSVGFTGQRVPLEPATEDALDSIAAEMGIGRSDLIQIVLREWLETNAYLPVRQIDEESETDGSA
jgi:hypothetical protein